MNGARYSVVPIVSPRADDRGHATRLCRALTLRHARCGSIRRRQRADCLHQYARRLDDDQLVTTHGQRGAELLRSSDQLVHLVALVGGGPDQRLVGLVVADRHTRHLDDLLVLNGDPGQQAQPIDRLEGAVPATVSLVEGETAETVEYRLALVDLDGRDGVDAVSHFFF